MDDTAFFYSRTLRVVVVLAIIIPLVGIGGLLWYFASDMPEDVPQEQSPVAASTNADEGEMATDDEEDEEEEELESSTDDNPLKPLGPPASSMVVSGSCGSCVVG